MFTLFSKHNLFNNAGVFCSSSFATTSVNPDVSEHHISNPNISKQIVVTDTIILFSLNSICCFVPFIKLFKFLFVIITPLGNPVEPDVYIKYANASDFVFNLIFSFDNIFIIFLLNLPLVFTTGIFTYIFSDHVAISLASFIINSSSSANTSNDIGISVILDTTSFPKSL